MPGGTRWRWRVLRVSGPSMVPTLRDRDVIVARVVHRVARAGDGHRAGGVHEVRPGDVVVARYRSMPGRLVVKTAAAAAGDGWLLRSDNAAAGGDSSVHGVADVLALVVLRLRARARPRRIRRGPA